MYSNALGVKPKKFMETHSSPVRYTSPSGRCDTILSPWNSILVFSLMPWSRPSLTWQTPRETLPMGLIVFFSRYPTMAWAVLSLSSVLR